MTTPRAWSLAVTLAVFAAGWTVYLMPTDDNSAGHPGGSPRLVNTCLITNDVKRLVEFYEPILALKAKNTGEDYAEFPTGMGVLAIFSMDAQEKFLVRPKRRTTGAWCCNSGSAMWIENTGDYRAV